MFGFLNVLLAAALLVDGGTDEQAALLLEESDPTRLEFASTHVAWHGPGGAVILDGRVLLYVRERVLVSVGSCSFTEPVDESRALGWL
jgi:hypothetical protein